MARIVHVGIGALLRVIAREGAGKDTLLVIAKDILERLQRPLDVGVRLIAALALEARRNASCCNDMIRFVRTDADGPRVAAIVTSRATVPRR